MKTVIITGANGNLGVATVKEFLHFGYKVIAIDQGNNNLSFADGYPNFEWHRIDITKEAEAEKFIANVITGNTVDAALLLVGGFKMGDIAATDISSIKEMILLNFDTAYNMARPLFKHMMEHGHGRIVLIGSRPALVPAQGKKMIAYALSKSLLFNLAEILNNEAKDNDVVVNMIVPSTLDTAANRKSMPGANPADWVKPEEVAAIMEFICSEKGKALRETVLKVYNNA